MYKVPAYRLFLSLILVALIMVPSGCDTLDPGRESLVTETDVSFEFRTTAEQLSGGTVISSETNLDVADALAEIGFAKADIVSAEVVGAQLRQVQPLTATLGDVLSSATLRLSAGGNEASVAQTSSFGSGSTTEMETMGGNIGAFVRASSAAVNLQALPTGDLESGAYVFSVRLSIRLTLEGV